MQYEQISGSYLRASYLNTIPIIAEEIRRAHGPFNIDRENSYIQTEEVRSPFHWINGAEWPLSYYEEPVHGHEMSLQSFTLMRVRHDHDRDIWFRVGFTASTFEIKYFRGHETALGANWCACEPFPWQEQSAVWVQSGHILCLGNIEQRTRVPVNSWFFSADDHVHIDPVDIVFSGDGANRLVSGWGGDNLHSLWGWVRCGTYASVAHLYMLESAEDLGGVITFSGSLPLLGGDEFTTWPGEVCTLKKFDIIYQSDNPAEIYTWAGVRAKCTASGLEFVLNGLDAEPNPVSDMSLFDIDRFICISSKVYNSEIYN